MASVEKKLPLEQWQQVLRNVSCGDLCNVMLTSRHMNSVASWPELWAGMRVNLGKVRENGLAQLYSINRFKRIKEIDFEGTNFTSMELERLFTDIPGSPLESINFSVINLSGVPPELLASAVGSLETITLWATQLTTDQCVKVLEAVFSSTTLVDVDLSYVDLRGVPPDLLASAVSRLKTVKLNSSMLTRDQWIRVLEASISSTTVVNVDLSHVDLCGVPPDLLASAVSRLKTVILASSILTTDQCINILEASTSSTTLVSIDLTGINMSGVPPNILANAVSRLKTVILKHSRLTTDQCIKILETSTSSTTLVSIDLTGINLSGVPPNLLASAVSRLKTVILHSSKLTGDQCIRMLEASLSSTTLVNIDLSYVNLYGVPPDLLASAVSRLKTVKLDSSGLTTDQCINILEASTSSTTMVSIDLSYVHLCGVPPDLLANAVSCLKTVKLKNSRLTTDQCIKVLEASIFSTTLDSIDLSYVNLDGVPHNLLANAVSRLKTVILLWSRLTPEQCVAVLKGISSSTTLSRVDLTGNDFEKKIPTNLQYLITSLPSHVTF